MGFAPAFSTAVSSMQAKKKSPTLRSEGVRSASGLAAEASSSPQRNCRFSVAVLPYTLQLDWSGGMGFRFCQPPQEKA
jgi:hypothetical protein